MMYRCLLTAILFVGISACGFQLRGTGQALLINQSVVVISKTPFGEFEKTLRQTISESGGVISSEPTSSSFNVKLVKLDIEEQGVSRDSSGRASEIILRATLHYQLFRESDLPAKNKATLSSQASFNEVRNIKTSQSYFQDYRNPISSHNQLKETQKAIYQILSRRLVQQIKRSL
ncbi:LPS-assembly lipoprotein LptE [Aliikangiella sp. IMCC44359]|uniref:LPS-assembly lipoprotein LptE n=1 Tax=Aliikangiella sp. IMCC44359 TaxID=3459125 RepID=UPI00403B0ABE